MAKPAPIAESAGIHTAPSYMIFEGASTGMSLLRGSGSRAWLGEHTCQYVPGGMYSTWIPPGGLTLHFGINVRGSTSGNTRIITYIEASLLACIERSQPNQSEFQEARWAMFSRWKSKLNEAMFAVLAQGLCCLRRELWSTRWSGRMYFWSRRLVANPVCFN